MLRGMTEGVTQANGAVSNVPLAGIDWIAGANGD
jgi:hypothetical protein